MWTWLGRILGWAGDTIGGPVVTLIHDLIHGVWGWLSTLFGNVGLSWTTMFKAGAWLHRALENLGLQQLATVWHIIFTRIPAVVAWAWNHLQRLWIFATAIAKRLEHDVLALIARIGIAIDKALAWVRDHVYVPLHNLLIAAWQWITKRGELVFYYITHPDKLAALLFDSILALLEREAWAVGSKLGKFFLSLVTHNLRRFILLLEDILMAVL